MPSINGPFPETSGGKLVDIMFFFLDVSNSGFVFVIITG
jgi:hypothetical protein